MKRTLFTINQIGGVAFCLSALTLAIGCGPKPETTSKSGTHAEEHAHASHGPHDGDIIELGNEAYHAELVHDEGTGTVMIYLLDSEAKNAVSIEATELIINLKHEGEAKQFSLAATPDAGDPAGRSSRFASSDKELGESLEHEEAEPQLVVTIAGQQYRGKIAHDHGHDHEKHAH